MNDVWLSQGSEIIVWVSNFSSFCILKQGSAIITLRVFFFFFRAIITLMGGL